MIGFKYVFIICYMRKCLYQVRLYPFVWCIFWAFHFDIWLETFLFELSSEFAMFVFYFLLHSFIMYNICNFQTGRRNSQLACMQRSINVEKSKIGGLCKLPLWKQGKKFSVINLFFLRSHYNLFISLIK